MPERSVGPQAELCNERLYGSLSATVVVHPCAAAANCSRVPAETVPRGAAGIHSCTPLRVGVASGRTVEADGKRITRELRYGTIAWNVWTALTCARSSAAAHQTAHGHARGA